MLLVALLAATKLERRSRQETAIETVREIIAADPSSHPMLAHLARSVDMSPYHLTRRFRAQVGSSIHEYRLRLRLLVAFHRSRD